MFKLWVLWLFLGCEEVAYLLTRKVRIELPEDLVKAIESTGRAVDEVVKELIVSHIKAI